MTGWLVDTEETADARLHLAMYRPNTLDIADQQRPKVNPRRHRRTPALLRTKLRAPLLEKLVEALGLQQLIQALIKRVSRSRRQLAVCDPDVLLLLPLLARSIALRRFYGQSLWLRIWIFTTVC